MSDYMFASTAMKMTKARASKRDKIARLVGGSGCGFTYFYDKARHEYRGWGYAPNRGEPFDAATSKAIQDAWILAGV